jgi:hypothetical protein
MFFLRKSVFTLFIFSLLATIVLAGDEQWKPVSPAELSLKESAIEKDADAEAIFWEVRVDDGALDELSLKHYVRVKIFTERGREKYSKVDIPFLKGKKIKDIFARVIKADGSIVELKKEDVFDRDIVKADGVKIKAKSFAVPGIEPGAIVEYRYREVIRYGVAHNMPMIFQRDIPIQEMTYYFRPANNARTLSFNMNETKFEKEKNGFFRAQMKNIPSLREEPQMPPEDEVRAWMLVYYVNDLKMDTDKYWSNAGYWLVQGFDIKDTLKPGGDLKKAAAEIIGGAATPEEKLTKLYDFCKTQIKNLNYDPSVTEEERDKIKPNDSTGQTYKKRQGFAVEINQLFAALADAAGFDTRIAFSGDRRKIFFSPRYAHSSFVHLAGVAINVGGEWRYFDPGTPYTPVGMLGWFEEGESVFLLSSKDYITTKTPLAEPEKSVAKRTGKFKLLEDGTLEGDVRIEYTGHLGSQYKANNYEDSPNKREETLKEELKRRINAAEASSIQIENVTDHVKPFVYAYKIRVPGYAQKTGKRLFLQPNFFEYGTNPLFTASTRKYPVVFNFPWSENDQIEIEMPAGYSLEKPDAPAPVSDPQNIGSNEIKMRVSNDGRVLTYQRQFHFGKNGNILFPVQAYPVLKTMFEVFHKNDTHSMVLRQGATTAANK